MCSLSLKETTASSLVTGKLSLDLGHNRCHVCHKHPEVESLPANLWTILRFSSTWCPVRASLWPRTLCEHRSQSWSAGPGEALSANWEALRGNSWRKKNPHTFGKKKTKCTSAPTHLESNHTGCSARIRAQLLPAGWLTFYQHVKVVHVLSRWVCCRAHVLSPVVLLRRRYGQELAVVEILGSCRHPVPHFHPFHLGCGAAEADGWFNVVWHTHVTSPYIWTADTCCLVINDTYYPSGMHSSCRSSPFNTTFFVWTPEGSSMLGILTGGASVTARVEGKATAV